ncbi:MAG: hypothetical protein QM534_05105 [Sediminibacterium sp.]|nr:hypothetical protein [Sediminibacterium sp.]
MKIEKRQLPENQYEAKIKALIKNQPGAFPASSSAWQIKEVSPDTIKREPVYLNDIGSIRPVGFPFYKNISRIFKL